MDIVYYLSSFLAAVGLPLFALVVLVLLIKPSILNKRMSKVYSRKRIAGIGAVSLVVATIGFGTVLAATEPEGVKQERYAREAADAKALQLRQQQDAKQKAEATKPVVKTETKQEVVAFESTEQTSPTLAQGQKQISVQGVNGERTITYEVTYIEGKETARKEIKREVTRQPVMQVTAVGAYVAPAPSVSSTPSPAASSPSVSAPTQQSSARTGAICKDGWQSSATGSGACSHHGGVAYWLYG